MPSSIIIGQGGGGGSNASVGPTGATAPTSATEIGIIVAGNLEGVSAANPLPVSGAGGGTQYTDETAETAGAFTITAVGLYNGTDVVGLRGDASNNLLIKVNTALPAGTNLIGQVEITDGTNILGTSTHPVRIDPTGTTVQPVDGGLTHNNAAPTTTNLGVLPALANAAAPTYTEGDQVLLSTDLAGNTRVIVENPNTALGTVGGTPSAYAVQTSAIAATALPAAATATDTVVPMADKFGRVVVLPQAPRDLVGTASVQNTGSSGTLITGVSNIYADITNLVLTNETATATVVSISDGTVTYKFALAASGGGVFPFSPPLPATTADVNWTVSNSGSCTIDCVVTYVKNK